MIDQLFMDCECPNCGRTCGNGGSGNTFCCPHCGWNGKIEIHPDDIKAIQDFIQRARNREKEATP